MPHPVYIDEKTVELMSELPDYYQNSAHAESYCYVIAQEVKRVEGYIQDAIDRIFPQTATGANGGLAIHEAYVGLPVRPVGLTDEQRREYVMFAYQFQSIETGADQRKALDNLFGQNNYTIKFDTPGPFQLTITYPYADGAPGTAQVEALLRHLFAGHLEIIAGYSEGWIVGVSGPGDPI